MSFAVLLDNFEGPLDLLLQLIERDKLDVRELQLSQLTASYIEHMQGLELHPHEVNHFLMVATQLVFTKSQRVLPNSNKVDADEDGEDIARRLELYQSYRLLASKLAKLCRQPYLERDNQMSKQATKALSIAPKDIQSALAELRQRGKITKKPSHRVRLKPINLKDIIVRVAEHLDRTGQISLSQLYTIAGNQREAILSFMAILELAKQDRLTITQLDESDYQIQPVGRRRKEVMV